MASIRRNKVEFVSIGSVICYLRNSRPKTPVLCEADEAFPIGGGKMLCLSDGDAVTVVAAAVTLYEALKAADGLKGQGTGITVIDAYNVKPLARDLILSAPLRKGGGTDGQVQHRCGCHREQGKSAGPARGPQAGRPQVKEGGGV